MPTGMRYCWVILPRRCVRLPISLSFCHSELIIYLLCVLGLKPQFDCLWREATVGAVIDQGPGLPTLEVKAGDRIRSSFRNAHLNVSMHRPTKLLHIYLTNVFSSLGQPLDFSDRGHCQPPPPGQLLYRP